MQCQLLTSFQDRGPSGRFGCGRNLVWAASAMLHHKIIRSMTQDTGYMCPLTIRFYLKAAHLWTNTGVDHESTSECTLFVQMQHTGCSRDSATTQCWQRRPDCIRPLTDDSQHVLGCLVHLDEDAVVNLSQSHQLETLPDLGWNLVDTTDSHDKGEFWLGSNIIVALLLGLASQPRQRANYKNLHTGFSKWICSVFNDESLNGFKVQGKTRFILDI